VIALSGSFKARESRDQTKSRQSAGVIALSGPFKARESRDQTKYWRDRCGRHHRKRESREQAKSQSVLLSEPDRPELGHRGTLVSASTGGTA
jgi:hypothetical protein